MDGQAKLGDAIIKNKTLTINVCKRQPRIENMRFSIIAVALLAAASNAITLSERFQQLAQLDSSADCPHCGGCPIKKAQLEKEAAEKAAAGGSD